LISELEWTARLTDEPGGSLQGGGNGLGEARKPPPASFVERAPAMNAGELVSGRIT